MKTTETGERSRSHWSLHARAMHAAAIMVCFSIRALAADSNTPPSFKLSEVLPVGRSELEIMTIEYTARAKELALKMQASVATNRDWFLEHVKRSKPGEPLEYDQRLGVTRQEYSEYLTEAENRHLASTGHFLPCIFRLTGDILTLDVGDSESPLSKVRLNVASGELFASVGKVGMPTWSSSSDPGIPIGPYEAYSWNYEKSDLKTFDVRIVRLDIYRLKETGKILWRFQDSEMVHKQNRQSFDVHFQHSPRLTHQYGSANGSQPILLETNRMSPASSHGSH